MGAGGRAVRLSRRIVACRWPQRRRDAVLFAPGAHQSPTRTCGAQSLAFALPVPLVLLPLGGDTAQPCSHAPPSPWQQDGEAGTPRPLSPWMQQPPSPPTPQASHPHPSPLPPGHSGIFISVHAFQQSSLWVTGGEPFVIAGQMGKAVASQQAARPPGAIRCHLQTVYWEPVSADPGVHLRVLLNRRLFQLPPPQKMDGAAEASTVGGGWGSVPACASESRASPGETAPVPAPGGTAQCRGVCPCS